jgi:CMP-N-acetylneuraminic acid synthetase
MVDLVAHKQPMEQKRSNTVATYTALVPMRHHSERIPEKNFRVVAGKRLYAHILETLLECSSISKIVVDTDSAVIKDGITAAYPSVVLIDRPERLRDGEVPMNEVLLHDVSQVISDFYLQTHCTNPLLKSGTIERAIEIYEREWPACDSLFSVTKVQTRFWDGDGVPINHDPTRLLRTQDLPPMYEENSCMYIFERDIFLERKNRIGLRPNLFVIDPIEALDIDEESDFRLAEYLLKDNKTDLDQ